MARRLRTFIALDPGKAIRDRLVALQESLARGGGELKWVEPENLHVTLLFLGEVDEREVPKVCRVVAERSQGHAAFPMVVETVGCFPTPRRPRVVWVGVGEGQGQVVTLHDAVEEGLLELGGYRREARRYTPHITLGRVKREEGGGEELAGLLAKKADWQAGETTVREVLVMSSQLTPEGPVYSVLSRAPLRG
jgi:RNA 2',3'-cyclic 3'-phosphodiesterase